MNPLSSMLIVLPLIVFWLWMFWEMTRNNALPANSAVLTWPPSSKFEWTLVFIFLNVFAAVFYYWYEFRNRR